MPKSKLGRIARAAKELERALREAAKEEESLQKALLLAQEQFDHASGEQRAMYEERIRGMEDRLKEVLERKERARSMAQQTKTGHVYILSNVGSFGEDCAQDRPNPPRRPTRPSPRTRGFQRAIRLRRSCHDSERQLRLNWNENSISTSC